MQLGIHVKLSSDVANTLKRINDSKLRGLVEKGQITQLGMNVLRPLIKQSLQNQTKVPNHQLKFEAFLCDLASQLN